MPLGARVNNPPDIENRDLTSEEVQHLLYLSYIEVSLQLIINSCEKESKRWFVAKAVLKYLYKLDKTYPTGELPLEFTLAVEEFFSMMDSGVKNLLENHRKDT